MCILAGLLTQLLQFIVPLCCAGIRHRDPLTLTTYLDRIQCAMTWQCCTCLSNSSDVLNGKTLPCTYKSSMQTVHEDQGGHNTVGKGFGNGSFCIEVQLTNRSLALQDRQGSRSRSRSRSYSRSRSGSYSRSPSRSRLRSASPPRRYNRSVTPPPRRTFGPRPDQQRPAPAPVHGIPPPGSGPPPPPAPSQPYGVLPPVTSYPPSSGAFGHTAPNPLAGMFQPLPAAPPANLTLMNQQVRITSTHA